MSASVLTENPVRDSAVETDKHYYCRTVKVRATTGRNCFYTPCMHATTGRNVGESYFIERDGMES